MVGIRLNLLAQLPDQNPQTDHRTAIFGAPDRLQQPAMREAGIGVLSQVLEQVEFLQSEADLAAARGQAPGDEVDFHIS